MYSSAMPNVLRVSYARSRRFHAVFLWTIAGLAPAHHLYEQAGFTLTESPPVRQ